MAKISVGLRFVAEIVDVMIEGVVVEGRQIVAYLADDNTKVVFRVNGKQAKMGDFEQPFDKMKKSPAFHDDLVTLFNYVYRMGEITLDMEISILPRKVWPNNPFWNTMAEFSWKGSNGKDRVGRMPFSVHNGMYVNVNGPQWCIERQYVPIVTGKLVETIKALAEHQFRLGAEKSNRKVPEGTHNHFCTSCSWYRSEGYERDGHEDNEGITISCVMNKFVPFNTRDITTEMREKVGITEDWRSSLGDAIWAYVKPEEVVADTCLSLDDWRQIGAIIDNDRHPHHRGYENRFNNFERFYDDCLYIDKIAARSSFDQILDLDTEIERLRREEINRAARTWAAKLPEYSGLFLQTNSDKLADITAGEPTEQTRKVKIETFLNNFILVPCACGIRYRTNSKGELHCYRAQGYPLHEDPVDVFAVFEKNYG